VGYPVSLAVFLGQVDLERPAVNKQLVNRTKMQVVSALSYVAAYYLLKCAATARGLWRGLSVIEQAGIIQPLLGSGKVAYPDLRIGPKIRCPIRDAESTLPFNAKKERGARRMP
jgi:hypothetical protein